MKCPVISITNREVMSEKDSEMQELFESLVKHQQSLINKALEKVIMEALIDSKSISHIEWNAEKNKPKVVLVSNDIKK